ncbi:PAS domain-containing protein [Temperatibacter marinus]|uniref:PAS domain-containing protein n=1 Tax=Temperatibacter marinus TaxID=1456591 RepID=A0AA52HAI4_9PROT|nr:hypothetical protein [Temperatibacter marinus]WND02633.1 PAS domain-containing protein [Temperatibacter marinus]
MNKNIDIGDSFLMDVYKHWTDIKGDSRYPNSRHFRPQKFARNMTRLAVFERSAHKNSVNCKLMGSSVSDLFHLPDGEKDIGSIRDDAIKHHLQGLIDRTSVLHVPEFLEETIQPDSFLEISYSVLCLPFSTDTNHEPTDLPTTYIYAFSLQTSQDVETDYS